MSKNIFDKMSPIAAFCAQLFHNAGLDLTAIVAAGDTDALKTKLANVAGADVEKAITEATSALQAEIATATETIKTVTARAEKAEAATLAATQLFTQGLTAAGIAPKPADEAKGLQASDITTAVETHVSLKGAELAAQQGKVPPVAAEVAPSAAGQKKNEMKLTAFLALGDHARCQFLRDGGKLID